MHNPYSELFLAIYLFVVRFKQNAVHFNQGHTISKKRFCLFINRLNVVKEKAFSEAGLHISYKQRTVMISTGKNLVHWNYVPHTEGEWEHIAFGADPVGVGVGVGVASCLNSIS